MAVRVGLTMLRMQDALPVPHGFTTRDGGVSSGALASLNLARRPTESDEALSENWRRALAVLCPGVGLDAVALLDQVHGAGVVTVTRGGGVLRPVATADAAVTAAPSVVLAVRTADCVPVLLAAPGAVGVAHAGWRGLCAGVIAATVADLCGLAGCAPSRVRVAVGPHIQRAAYEVGADVVAAIAALGLDPSAFCAPGPRGRPHVDLGVVAEVLLERAGVASIASSGRCTAAENAFFSHRRDGPGTGRQAGLIMVEAA